MQVNMSKFRQNGGCGFLLKPDVMFRNDFDPRDPHCLVGVDTLAVNVKVIAGNLSYDLNTF